MFQRKIHAAVLVAVVSWAFSGCAYLRPTSYEDPIDHLFSMHRSYGPQLDKTFRQARVDALIRDLSHRNVSVRRHAALALGGVRPDPEKAAPALIDALSDKDAVVRQNAAKILKLIGTPEAKKAAEEFAKNNC